MIDNSSNLIKTIKEFRLRDEKGFIRHIELAASVAKEMENDKKIGQLPTNGEIREELKELISATKNYKKIVNSLRNSTRSSLDALHIKNSFPLNSDKSTLHDTLARTLETVIEYSNEVIRNTKTRDHNDFYQLEKLIAQDFQACGGTITTYEDGAFAKLLIAFRTYCDIDGYNPETVSSTHIRRLRMQI